CDARYLAGAPLALIPMDEELRETLAALGILTGGAFAALDADDVERRWGAEGLDAWRLARGEDRRRPVLARVNEPRVVDVELPAPTSTMEPVLFLARAALDTLAAELVSDGRAAAAIAVTLTLDSARSALPGSAPPHTVTREVRFPRPTARAVHLFDQCRALLEQWPLTAPACGVKVAVVATAPLSSEQGDLLTPEWRDAAAADAALARLRAELGAGTVVRPVERDEHRPERQGEWKEEHPAVAGRQMSGDNDPPTSGVNDPPAAARNQTAAVLRLLEAPEAVEVERRSGRPAAVRWRGRRHAFAHLQAPSGSPATGGATTATAANTGAAKARKKATCSCSRKTARGTCRGGLIDEARGVAGRAVSGSASRPDSRDRIYRMDRMNTMHRSVGSRMTHCRSRR